MRSDSPYIEDPLVGSAYLPSLVSNHLSVAGSWQSWYTFGGTFLPGAADTRQQSHLVDPDDGSPGCSGGGPGSREGRSSTASTVYSRPRHTNLAGRPSVSHTPTGSGRTPGHLTVLRAGGTAWRCHRRRRCRGTRLSAAVPPVRSSDRRARRPDGSPSSRPTRRPTIRPPAKLATSQAGHQPNWPPAKPATERADDRATEPTASQRRERDGAVRAGPCRSTRTARKAVPGHADVPLRQRNHRGSHSRPGEDRQLPYFENIFV
jgi:hypothetical protein